MRCPKCGTDNAAGSRFCNHCGISPTKRCLKWAFESPSEARFCSQCGAPLESTVAQVRAGAALHDAAGERRHLTVLFCDLVGSTEIAAQLDPEEWREMVAAYQRAATEAITRFGGYGFRYSRSQGRQGIARRAAELM